MLDHLRHVFFKFRVFLGAIRTGLLGFALVIAAWIFAAPPSQSEIARLGLDASEQTPGTTLRAHRIAKLLVLIESDQFYELVADQAGAEVSADDLRLGVILAAEGTPLRDTTTAPTQDTGIGAKFVAARTN